MCTCKDLSVLIGHTIVDVEMADIEHLSDGIASAEQFRITTASKDVFYFMVDDSIYPTVRSRSPLIYTKFISLKKNDV